MLRVDVRKVYADVFSGVIRSHFASIYAIVAALGEAMRLCGNVTHLEVA